MVLYSASRTPKVSTVTARYASTTTSPVFAAWPSLARSCRTYRPSTSGVNVGVPVSAPESDGSAPPGAEETVHA